MKGLLTWIIVYLGVLTILDRTFHPAGFVELLVIVVFSWVVAEVAQKVIES